MPRDWRQSAIIVRLSNYFFTTDVEVSVLPLDFFGVCRIFASHI